MLITSDDLLFILQSNKVFIPGGLYPGRLIHITATPGHTKCVTLSFLYCHQRVFLLKINHRRKLI